MILSLFSAAVFWWCLMVPCEGSGRAVVILKSYKNPSHRLNNGKCCDHRFLNFGRCYPCDAYFKLCVTQTCATCSGCNIGRSQTHVVGKQDDHRFHIRRAFAFDSFSGSITVGVEVWDKDKFTKDDYVDSAHAFVTSVRPGPFNSPFKKDFTLRGSYVTVGLEINLYCDKNYYGAACNVKCIPRDDSSGHYTCDHQGEKICKSGWFGSSCTRHCVPRDDPKSGHFYCDKDGNKRCLRNWQGPSCKNCIKNWFGQSCSTYCVPQASDELGHYKCNPVDGTKKCLPSWFGRDCRTQCIPHDDDSGHYDCAHDGSKTCLPDWHGQTCTAFCVPQDDDELGHYACDSDGNKVCYDGFDGFSINCSLTCLPSQNETTEYVEYTCTESGVKVCNPGWYGPDCTEYCVEHNDSLNGHYTCDPRDGKKVCLEGWFGRDCRYSKEDNFKTE
ncbi:protein jagged-1a-like [Montipora capricornis]|uniref:protein jagged-1a-like n=1 Tax=Montipora capricornis TaxID=246305 RepID=UPI0035F16EB5